MGDHGNGTQGLCIPGLDASSPLNESFPPRKADVMKKDLLKSSILTEVRKDPVGFRSSMALSVLGDVGRGEKLSPSLEKKIGSIYKCLSEVEDMKEQLEEEKCRMVSKLKQAQIEVDESGKYHQKKSEFYKERFRSQDRVLRDSTLKYENEKRMVENLRKELCAQRVVSDKYRSLHEHVLEERNALTKELDKMSGRMLENVPPGELVSLRKRLSSAHERVCDHLVEGSQNRVRDLESEVSEKDKIIEFSLSCNICYKSVNPHVVFPCGHHACKMCAQRLTSCHVCRRKITSCLNRIVFI
jgi:hypothetical protein